MATKSKGPGTSLFNNPTMSDVKIKQHYKGKVREYHAHKAVLMRGSQFFWNAFTGNFKEATDDVIEIHDDNPEHFEFALKFLYTQEYDADALVKLAGGNAARRISIPIGVNVIADKYDISRLVQLVAADVEPLLAPADSNILTSVIRSHYETGVGVGSSLGTCIARVLVDHKSEFIQSIVTKGLIQQFPVFAADLALNLHARDTLGIKNRMTRCPWEGGTHKIE